MLLRILHSLALFPCTYTYNAYLEVGIFPDTWKEVIIYSVPKISDPSFPKGIRPTTITCALFKPFLRIVHRPRIRHTLELRK